MLLLQRPDYRMSWNAALLRSSFDVSPLSAFVAIFRLGLPILLPSEPVAIGGGHAQYSRSYDSRRQAGCSAL